MASDSDLLRHYANNGNEAAFSEVVRRHIDLVYASAVRLLNGNSALAQDVTQIVFTDLARKASQLASHATVAGWLHTSVRYTAANAIRGEMRRRTHEQEAAMSDQTTTEEVSWMQMRPLIDEAVGQLRDAERNALLLRFFEDKSHREVAETLGLNESAARKRVDRAVEKMRAYFARRGVKTTAALLVATFGSQAANAATPAGLAASVSSKSLLGAATSKGVAVSAWHAWFGGKTKAAMAATLVVATSSAALVYTQLAHETTPEDTREIAALPSTQPAESTGSGDPVMIDLSMPVAVAIPAPAAAAALATAALPAIQAEITADLNSATVDATIAIKSLTPDENPPVEGQGKPEPNAQAGGANTVTRSDLLQNGLGLQQNEDGAPGSGMVKHLTTLPADGHRWTIQNSDSKENLYGALWDGHKFIVTGDNGLILTSTDGVKWAKLRSGVGTRLNDIVWNGKIYVIVGEHTILTSDDGKTWKAVFPALSENLWTVTWCAPPPGYDSVPPKPTMLTSPPSMETSGKFIASGEDGTLLTSRDGIVWQKQTIGTTRRIFGVAYSGTSYVATSDNESTFFTSTNGAKWTRHALSAEYWLHQVAWGSGQFVVTTNPGAKSDNAYILTSANGSDWTKRVLASQMPGCARLTYVAWTGGEFVASGDAGWLLTSPDGKKWSLSETYLKTHLGRIAANDKTMVVVGEDGIILTSPVATPAN